MDSKRRYQVRKPMRHTGVSDPHFCRWSLCQTHLTATSRHTRTPTHIHFYYIPRPIQPLVHLTIIFCRQSRIDHSCIICSVDRNNLFDLASPYKMKIPITHRTLQTSVWKALRLACATFLNCECIIICPTLTGKTDVVFIGLLKHQRAIPIIETVCRHIAH